MTLTEQALTDQLIRGGWMKSPNVIEGLPNPEHYPAQGGLPVPRRYHEEHLVVAVVDGLIRLYRHDRTQPHGLGEECNFECFTDFNRWCDRWGGLTLPGLGPAIPASMLPPQ